MGKMRCYACIEACLLDNLLLLLCLSVRTHWHDNVKIGRGLVMFHGEVIPWVVLSFKEADFTMRSQFLIVPISTKRTIRINSTRNAFGMRYSIFEDFNATRFILPTSRSDSVLFRASHSLAKGQCDTR